MKSSFVAALLVMGCIDYHVSPSWTPEDSIREATVEAANVWCERSDGLCCPTVVESGGLPIKVVDELKLGTKDVCAMYVFEHYDWDPSEILIKVPLCSFNDSDGTRSSEHDVMLHLLLHEFGHSCGLDDDPEPGTLMSNRHELVMITEKDIERL